jgi:hypothetical protein
MLLPAGFVTYQADKGVSTGKVWQLHRRAALEPASSKLIRVHERHLRKAGPLRALSAYARDKNTLKLVRCCARCAGGCRQQGRRNEHNQLCATARIPR